MSKRYKKSESRKGKPYNKSSRRRPHPPYDESGSRDRREARALELERDTALGFDLKVPDVNWQLPTIPDISIGSLNDIPKAETDLIVPAPPKVNPLKPQAKPNARLELPEFETKPTTNKPQVKAKPQQPQSLGQKPKPLSREEKMRREIQRRQAAQQQQRSQMKRKEQVHPAAIIGPVIIMFVVMAFLFTIGIPAIAYLIVLFLFGRHIWSIIQGGK